jgi:predicted enzyme related to lactoylglutathione lyase
METKMFEVTRYPDATFCWADLATTDTAGGKAFYTTLFGWDYQDRPIAEGVYYTMFQKDGHHVAALGPMQPEQQAQGMPAFWTSYISVDDLEGTVVRVAELGGTVLMGPMDVFEEGRMALVMDPTGAPVALWKAGNHIGAGLVNTVGAMSWNELATRDPERAAAFFTELLGWDVELLEEIGYRTLTNRGRMAGGIIQIGEDWGDVLPHWMVYFTVADLDQAIAKVKELGGQAMEPMESPGVGRFAVVGDPQGAVFTVIQLVNPDPAPVEA